MAAVVAAVVAMVLAVAAFMAFGGDDAVDAAAAETVVTEFWDALESGDGEQACGLMTPEFQHDFFVEGRAAEGASSCEEAVVAYAEVLDECEITKPVRARPRRLPGPDRAGEGRGGVPASGSRLTREGEAVPHPHLVYDLTESDGELRIYAADTTAPGFAFDPQPTPDTRKYPDEVAFGATDDDDSILREERFFPTRRC